MFAMAERASGLVTILFTDLVGSTELLARAGDEEAQRIFRAHHDLLAETAAAHGGEEVKWLGDGLMVAFGSAAGAVRAAVAMQQASRWPVHGERLAIRAGLNAGEALRDATDYFGLPVVVARRLCDTAQGGEIRCTEVVTSLLANRQEFAFADIGRLELKGVPEPIAALEVVYEAETTIGSVAHLPFVGREGELTRLLGLLGHAAAGHGGVAFVAGEPGIGKTRLTQELDVAARRDGVEVLWGHCLEGDWAPPYAPFVEVVEALADGVERDELRADLGSDGSALAQLVPALRERLPDLPDAAPVQPDEERFRLLDGVASLLIARSRRAPLLICLDDLHWADRSTVAMLRQVARFAPGHRLLILGTYRDGEVGAGHPLHEALGALRREVEIERVKLVGLEAKAVGELLEAVAEHDMLGSVGAAIAAETDGNPFFIKEVLRHLFEEGSFFRGPDGQWTSDRPVAELGIPEGVREVINRRLARLSADANKLVSAASLFEGEIPLGVVAAVSGMSEDAALDALDEVLEAQLLQPGGTIDAYRFTHALIRHTIAGQLSPSRRARLHLRAAEALAANSGAEPTPSRAGEIASQYHRAAGLPGAERGVHAAVVAAGHAENVAGYREAAEFLRIALELAPPDDPDRPRLLGRLGMALAWSLAFDEAVTVAGDAADALAAGEGNDSAAQYLSDAAYACSLAGGQTQAWALAARGLAYAAGSRDVAWARMVSFDHERRAAEDRQYPGIPLDTPERGESARVLRDAHLDPLGPAPMEAVFASGDDARASSNHVVLMCWAGVYGAIIPKLEVEAKRALAKGQLARAARCFCFIAGCHCAQGRLDKGRLALEESQSLAARLDQPLFFVIQVRDFLAVATDEGFKELAAVLAPLATANVPAIAWALGHVYADLARISARTGQHQAAVHYLGLVTPWLERAPAWAAGFPCVVSHAAETLWVLERLDHVALVEQTLREKVVKPDFRYPMVDGRLALARVCALQNRHDEAQQWFGAARRVLSEQDARPLLAIADFDEALMHVRRGHPDHIDRARPLLDAARRQFEKIGMTGWIRRADELGRSLG
jgi:class 3 adenylate cyclase